MTHRTYALGGQSAEFLNVKPRYIKQPPDFTIDFTPLETSGGVLGGAVGLDTTLQVGRSRARFSMVSLEFFIGIILPAALSLYQK